MAKQKDLFPYPTDKAGKEAARELHKKYKLKFKDYPKSEQKIPYFFKGDDLKDLHYMEGKGAKSGLQFVDLARKLETEGRRSRRGKEITPTLEDYTEAWGVEKGTPLYKQEVMARRNLYKQTDSATHDVDHFNSQKNPDSVGGYRNLRSQKLTDNRSDQVRQVPQWKKRLLGIEGGRQEYPRIHGPWPVEEMRDNIMKATDDPDEFAKYWVKLNNHSGNLNYEGVLKNGNGNGNGNGIKVNGKNGKKNGLLKAGALGALGTVGALTPTQEAAAQAREEILQGNYTQAGLTIGTDLVKSQTTGQVVAQGTKLAAKVAQQKIGRLVGKNVVKHAIKLVGKSAAKKGLALATGPAAPAIIAGLVVMDVYVAADALSGGNLTQFFKNQANKLKIQGPKMDSATAANSLKIMR